MAKFTFETKDYSKILKGEETITIFTKDKVEDFNEDILGLGRTGIIQQLLQRALLHADTHI